MNLLSTEHKTLVTTEYESSGLSAYVDIQILEFPRMSGKYKQQV